MTDVPTNAEQTRCWNEQSGPRWVALQRLLDAELAPLGTAVIDALQPRPGERVLDVGCGAGATALALAQRVAPGEVVGVDVSEPLLARARERASGVANVRFVTADAQTHHFDEPFDVVYSRFGVMFFADPDAAFINLHAALRPGGRLGFVCWRALADNPSMTVPLAAALPHLPVAPPPPPPADAPGPFAFADERRVRGILERAGFVDVALARHDAPLLLGGDEGLAGALEMVLQVGPLARAVAGLDDATRDRVHQAVRAALAAHETPEGVRMPSSTWLVTARRDA